MSASHSERPAIPSQLEQTRVVAILRRTDAAVAIDTVQALIGGGIRCLEVTCDSPGAFDMIAAIDRALGDQVLVGAGTVLDQTNAEAALRAGARFLVSPHTDTALIESFTRRGVAWIPGAFTATEILAAWRAGASIVKLFPAAPVGPAYVKDIRGPLRDIPLLPTGGVNLDNAAQFMQAGAWGLGIGSSLVDPRLVTAGDFGEIQARASKYIALTNKLGVA
jgi:2-dehydro-3-deoxyphosphogluconate aldolase / (4S)-4-hydroxy-2-oxoglutarate aldolase